MPRTVRLVGGSQHGTIQTLSSDLRTLRMVSREPRWATVSNTEAQLHKTDLGTETYERRTLDLGGVFTEFFVLDRLTDRQAARALADLIEGVQR